MEDGSDLRRIANAAGCGYIEKRRKPYVAHMSGAGSAAMIYLQNNVFDEALERLRMIFDGHDDVIVSMSGGKDSTVLFRMALMVAQERGRLPLKYAKVVCEHCGHVMFIKEGDAVFSTEQS